VSTIISSGTKAPVNNVLIDGYPRSIEQMTALDEIITKEDNIELTSVIEVRVSEQVAKEVGFCIADRLSDAYNGNLETGLFFSGTNGYRLNEIISVKELMDKLIQGE